MDTPNDGILLLRSFFHTNKLLVTKPNALADIIVANAYDFQKPKRIRNFLRHVSGYGLIIVEGESHKFQWKHPNANFQLSSCQRSISNDVDEGARLGR
jgi:hypothetical protein